MHANEAPIEEDMNAIVPSQVPQVYRCIYTPLDDRRGGT